MKYLSDGQDGFDTCAWLVAQPWCDGRICTMGLSYAAHTQAALGCLDPPGLVAQALDSGGFSNSWTGGIRQFGAFELKQATWAFNNALLSPEAQADPVLHAALSAENLRDWFTRMPWKPGHSPLRHHPDYEAYLFEQWTHGPFDGFWQQLGIWTEGWHDRYSRAACVHMSSWFDPYSLTATRNYAGLKQAGRGPQRLVLGPWTHGARSVTHFGDVEFGPAATIDSWAGDWLAYRIRFFQQHLQGAAGAEPPVRLFLMGGGSGRRTADGRLDHGGRWMAAADWPLPDARPVSYYLHGDGTLLPHPPGPERRGVAVRLRPAPPGADDRRQPDQPGAGRSRRQLRPGGRPGVLRLHAALSAARLPRRRAGVPNRAAGRAGRGGGAGRGGAVRIDGRAGHGFHRQADRRLSRQPRLSRAATR